MRRLHAGSRRRHSAPSPAPSSIPTQGEANQPQSDQAQLSQQQLPLCRVLMPVGNATPDAAGVVLVRQLSSGRYAFSIAADNLPAPSSLGSFDAYQGLVFVPDVITWVMRLFPTPEEPPTWAGSFADSTLNPVPNGIAQVRPLNTTTSATGDVILQGSLR